MFKRRQTKRPSKSIEEKYVNQMKSKMSYINAKISRKLQDKIRKLGNVL